MPAVEHPDCLIGIQTPCRETFHRLHLPNGTSDMFGKDTERSPKQHIWLMLLADACDTHGNIHSSRAGNILVFVDISQQNEQALYTLSLSLHTQTVGTSAE